ncbi:lipoyl(octanoyl) transferase 2 [Dermatophagoides pteronyssinus]|uniref:lipoyl(octanoyl) transferase 2 n=1 Tax=Dermatophagoides pteronyssinus TaxID=6956 RepID=UPI003F67A09D
MNLFQSNESDPIETLNDDHIFLRILFKLKIYLKIILKQNMCSKIRVIDLNRLSYNTALYIQQKLFTKVQQESSSSTTTNSIPNYLLLVEHEPVYTIGIRSKQYLDEKFQEKLKNLGADFSITNRGGLITFHGHGQLVAYPIVNLKNFPIIQNSIKKFVCQLESTIIDVCKEFGIKSARMNGYPGVWVDSDRKIAALGIHCSRYVTMHGIAINCNVNLGWFDHIVPCGIENKSITSISNELNKNISIEQVKPLLLKHFCEKLECKIEKH